MQVLSQIRYFPHISLVFGRLGEATERLTDEEANEIIRECKPIYPKKTNPATGEGTLIILHFLFYSIALILNLDFCHFFHGPIRGIDISCLSFLFSFFR